MRRKNSYRLEGYDYSTPGWYFVTICVKDMDCDLGEVIEGKIVLNEVGRVVKDCFCNIPNYYENVVLDEWVIMPNHLHGIIIIKPGRGTVGAAYHAVLPATNKYSHYGLLSKIVKSFKVVTHREIRKSLNDFAWQRSYYDHVINLNNGRELENIREYIIDNPKRWGLERK